MDERALTVEIGPLNVADEAAVCAEMLAKSEPWKTLQLSLDGARARLTDPAKEVYTARDGQGVVGFIIHTVLLPPAPRAKGG